MALPARAMLLLIACACSAAAAAAAPGPTAALHCGTTYEGLWDAAANSTTLAVFRGIPFAERPTGARRFAPAQGVNCSAQGRVEAKKEASACVQRGDNGKADGSEDCLYLDVFVPKAALVAAEAQQQEADGKGRRSAPPVVFWVYGGGNVAGSTQWYSGLANLPRLEQGLCLVAAK